jgi:tetratricopeptide (TPR) repeat protein
MWPAGRADDASATPPWLAAAIVAAVVLAFANAIGASFQFDDWNVIVADPRVQSLAAWWDGMPGIRPLLKLSYALNHASGLGPAGFHAVNVAVHAGNALLALALLRRWPGDPARVAVAATVAALFFALHPVQTEAVTYASGRSSSLAALSCLASLVAWLSGRDGSRAAALASPLLFALALGTRETAAVLPLALVLWNATAGGARRSGVLRGTAWHWAVLAAAGAAAALLPDYRRFFAASLGARPALAQWLTQADAVTYLAGQLVLPGRLNADPMLPVATALTPARALAIAALAALVAGGLLAIRRRPALAFGVLWFFLWLAPTNSFLPRLDVVNDRQLYLALLGPAWLAGLGVAALAARRRALAAAAAGTALVALGAATVARNAVYRDEVAFWQDVVAKSPGNARAHGNLGYALALAGRDAEAEQALWRAIELDPGNARAGVNLALLRSGALRPAPSAEGAAPSAP